MSNRPVGGPLRLPHQVLYPTKEMDRYLLNPFRTARDVSLVVSRSKSNRTVMNHDLSFEVWGLGSLFQMRFFNILSGAP